MLNILTSTLYLTIRQLTSPTALHSLVSLHLTVKIAVTYNRYWTDVTISDASRQHAKTLKPVRKWDLTDITLEQYYHYYCWLREPRFLELTGSPGVNFWDRMLPLDVDVLPAFLPHMSHERTLQLKTCKHSQCSNSHEQHTASMYLNSILFLKKQVPQSCNDSE